MRESLYDFNEKISTRIIKKTHSRLHVIDKMWLNLLMKLLSGYLVERIIVQKKKTVYLAKICMKISTKQKFAQSSVKFNIDLKC